VGCKGEWDGESKAPPILLPVKQQILLTYWGDCHIVFLRKWVTVNSYAFSFENANFLIYFSPTVRQKRAQLKALSRVETLEIWDLSYSHVQGKPTSTPGFLFFAFSCQRREHLGSRLGENSGSGKCTRHLLERMCERFGEDGGSCENSSVKGIIDNTSIQKRVNANGSLQGLWLFVS